MVSPMREKRAWPLKEKDADSAESAAFEAAVAVVKETVVRSGEVLVSAKEDLTDHKRWLEAQRAAVQADRARHERWLQRQKEKQEALDRREAKKRRRQLARQHAREAVENAVFAAVDAVLSFFWFCVARVASFFAFLWRSIVNAFVWVGARLRDLGSYATSLSRAGALAVARNTRALAGAAGSALSAAGSSTAAKSGELARSTGSAFAAAGSSLAAKSSELARSTGSAFAAAGSSLAAKSSELARSTRNKLVLARSTVAIKSGEPALHPADDLGTASAPVRSEPGEVAPEEIAASEAVVTPAAEAVVTPLVAESPLSRAGPAELASDQHMVAESAGADLAAASSASTETFAEVATVQELAEPAIATEATGPAPIPPAGDTIAARFAPTVAPIAAIVGSSLETLARLIASASAKAAPFAQAASQRISSSLSAISAKLHVLAPQVHGAIANGAEKAEVLARGAARRGGALLARLRPPQSGYENEVPSPTGALSLPGRIGSYDLSQMLIISGVVLLVCGALLIGGGLVLRAGAGKGTGPGAGTIASVAKPESPHSVLWFFDEPDLPIVERSVFSAELTQHGVRLTGLSFKAENNSDVPLAALEGVVKPDARRPHLKLEVKVDIIPAETEGTQDAAAAEVQGNGIIPPHAFFSLVVPFPPEAQDGEPGIALDDFIAAYGGLMLRLRYDVDGTEKSLIQYLSPEMLKAQLTEIQREADKS